ncbi:uncharacterized protein JCM6883_006702 [Sporobolomyces salmoneus]|uniref:uncharacterized protein n=1 Tax=Sporobolomyces salmoneus TaxID=183962 RepID=UPI00316CF7E5
MKLDSRAFCAVSEVSFSFDFSRSNKQRPHLSDDLQDDYEQPSQQQRPRQVPPPPPSTSGQSRNYPARDASLRRLPNDGNNSTEEAVDPHLEAALENRRRNGLPVDSRGGWTSTAGARTGGDNVRKQEAAVEQFEDQQQTRQGGNERNQGNPNQATTTRDSLMPLSQHATVSRMTSTRRYMDQLDEDDVEAMEEEEEEEGEDANDRGTWHSGWARDSVATVRPKSKGLLLETNRDIGRESAMSTKTYDSQSADAFHYSMYESMSTHPDESTIQNAHSQQRRPSLQPPLSPLPVSPTAPISPPSSTPSPSTAAPIVRIGPPSPTTDSFFNRPQDSTHWNDLPSSPPASPVSRGRQVLHPTSPVSPAGSNRAKSQTGGMNFSRPFVSNSSLSSLAQPPSNAAQPPRPIETINHQQRRPISPRSDSLESSSSPNPLDRKSSLGATSSSMGHSGSSAGHSMSSSWEERKIQAMRQHEEAKRAIDLAREQSRRNRVDQEYRNDGVEELRQSRRVNAESDNAYGGEEEDQENETSIHFPQLASETQLPESPYLAYAAPSPPQPSLVEGAFHSQSVFSEALPRSPPPHPVSPPPVAFSSEPRPAPAPPTTYQPSVSLPLPILGSPPLQRRPSDSPSLHSFHSFSNPHLTTAPAPINLSASAPPSSTLYSTSPPAPVTTKQRNVLRKPRPRRREDDDLTSSAPMSRAGSALSSHSQTSETSSKGSSTWARFRSRSKSRTRAADRTSTFFNDPAPPFPSFQVVSDFDDSSNYPQAPPLRHFHSSASLQPPRSTAPFPSPLLSSSPASSAASAFPSTPSATSPLSQADFARLQASRPPFLRSKTSFGNGNDSSPSPYSNPRQLPTTMKGDEQPWVLKNVTGPKTVQSRVVHVGESASVHGGGGGEGEEMERLNEGIEGVGFGLPRGRIGESPTSQGMGRSVSDQGPNNRQYQRDDRSMSPSDQTSVYSSNYSIYSLPPSPLNTTPTTPTGQTHFTSTPPSSNGHGGEKGGGGSQSVRNSTIQKAKLSIAAAAGAGGNAVRGQMMRTPSGNEKRVVDPVSPEDFLQVGIDHHEAGELERAAWCFEQSAKKDGGCGAGMLMYGLTLRHGWGCQLNAPLGFRYLQMAAESVVEDLDRVVFGGRTLTESEANTKAAKSELVLALHEIGVSYRFGWGVEKNKKMAVSYFTLSADLGDVDAQLDVAFSYANGKGCKKDLKVAAKYYRMAIEQGAENWGLSWIYKPKYM